MPTETTFLFKRESREADAHFALMERGVLRIEFRSFVYPAVNGHSGVLLPAGEDFQPVASGKFSIAGKFQTRRFSACQT